MQRITTDSSMAAMQANETRLQALFVLGLEGDAQAYQHFLKDLSTHLRAFFKRRLAALPDETEDLVQDTLMAIHNQRHTYNQTSPLTAWVHAIGRYKLIDLFRRRAVRENLNDPLEDDLAVFASCDIDAVDAQRDIAKMMVQLPDNQRLPIMHMKLEGLSVSETAQITHMSESAVKVGVHRGLKALAALMKGT